jgi:sortase A
MPRTRNVDQLTTEELRQLLIERRRADRQARLEQYRKSGRLIQLEPKPVPVSLEDLHRADEYLDDSEDALGEEGVRRNGRKRRVWVDRLLLFIEILAVIGLGFVLFNGANILRTLNLEVAQALVQPTFTPTPLISVVILPSGHTPPNSPGGVQPNEAEIPSHLLPLVQALASLPVPTPGPEQPVRIQIPAIGVDAPIVQGDGWEQLKKGVGQNIGSVNPGQVGNLVLSGHNDVFGEVFRNLDKLKTGDQIIVFTNQRSFTYTVQSSEVVEPTHVEVMASTRDSAVTLISCYPYLVDNQRIAVRGYLQK